jgi:phosphoserine phosphatase RsbU/P
MPGKPSKALYILLCAWILISMSYYVAGAAAMREKWFHSDRYARAPFDTNDNDGRTIDSLLQEARDAGLADGDVLASLDGRPFTGAAQFLTSVRRAKPGDVLQAGVRTPKGQARQVSIRLHRIEPPHFSLGMVAYLVLILGTPLLGLIVGYWVVAARPRDLNAWLVLMILCFAETVFGDLDWAFRPGVPFIVFGLWHLLVQTFAALALLWFGICFPERWRADRRLPWVKWLFLVLTVAVFAGEVVLIWALVFDVSLMPALITFGYWHGRIGNALFVAYIVLFLAALFDKLGTASTPDSRRRLRVLTIGSALSLGPTILIFAAAPLFGYDPQHGSWFLVLVPLIALFPLTLAYVVVVQRAMDVRILLRMGTKYLLAKATLLIVQIAVVCWILFRFVLPMIGRKEHEILSYVLLALMIGLMIPVFFMRQSLSARLQRWLDRKFFREAYNSEIVLSELSEQARRFTEKGPLIETVSRRIADVLHVQQIAVWLRGSRTFRLQNAMGLDIAGPVLLPETSVTVQNLVRTKRPAVIYRDRPEEWFAAAEPHERALLDRVNAELLLPLPGRETLMGLMALGPKRSQEAYTPTDLRVLQSVAAQTGLALEVSELAESLAAEAAQRERIHREIEIAREVQERLFPQHVPQIPGLSLAGTCRPALGVGGDYYDLIPLDDGRLGLAIGDVSGKGISAALLMASLRASLRGMTLDGPSDLSRVMQRINRLVYEASTINRYATFFFATYNPANQELRYVNAGHNPPMLLRSGAAEPVRLEAGGVVVGLLPQAAYEEQALMLSPGDLLIAYTDGISEAMTAADEEWGEERMLTAARQAERNASAEEILRTIFRAADQFTAGAEQHDDMTLLIMKLSSRPQ